MAGARVAAAGAAAGVGPSNQRTRTGFTCSAGCAGTSEEARAGGHPSRESEKVGQRADKRAAINALDKGLTHEGSMATALGEHDERN